MTTNISDAHIVSRRTASGRLGIFGKCSGEKPRVFLTSPLLVNIDGSVSFAMDSVARYVPHRAFPPYTYVPGQAPHPIRDPAGHMYGEAPDPPQLLVDQWWNCEEYLWGIDLFNHGYYWEAHEAWEGLWHAAGRIGPVADFLKGLIKLAAAGVKTREGSPAGRARHLRRALELIGEARCGAGSRVMGLDLKFLLNEVTPDTMDRDTGLPTGDPPIIFSFALHPERPR